MKTVTGDGEMESLLSIAAGPAPMFQNMRGNIYSFYLFDDIRDAESYVNWFHTIRNANANDIVKIHLNSSGGMVSTTIQFLRVLRETEAQVVISVEGNCMSAATMIFLAADTVEVSPHSIFMFHNYSGGAAGKGGEIYTQVAHMQQWSEALLQDVYEGFLTKKEIQLILNGQDIWMTSEEVMTRVRKKAKYLRGKRSAAIKAAFAEAEGDDDEN
jgi:ATP-dependent protease ClpP protease subunit